MSASRSSEAPAPADPPAPTPVTNQELLAARIQETVDRLSVCTVRRGDLYAVLVNGRQLFFERVREFSDENDLKFHFSREVVTFSRKDVEQ